VRFFSLDEDGLLQAGKALVLEDGVACAYDSFFRDGRQFGPEDVADSGFSRATPKKKCRGSLRKGGPRPAVETDGRDVM